MYENSGVAIIKKMGRFDTNVGKSSAEWLGENIRKDTAVGRAMDLVDTVTGWGAEKADEISWCLMYAAIEHETEQRTGLKRGTQEFNEETAKRFNAVMTATQVYDSTLSKSQWMRGTSIFDKMSTSFMSEPTLTVNMLLDAVMDFLEKHPGAKAHLARAAGVFVAQAFAVALMKSLITAARPKKDTERTYAEKYLAEFAQNFVDDVTPSGILNSIPLLRDIVSKAQGYEVERTDMSVIGDVIDKGEKLIGKLTDPKKEATWEDWIDALGAVGNLAGVPLRNVYRDGEAILRNMLGGGAAPLSETDWNDIKYSVLDNTSFFASFELWDSKGSAYYERMTDALQRGDMQTFENLYSYVTGAKGVKKDTADSGIRAAVKERYQAGTMDRETAAGILGDTLGNAKTVESWDKTEIREKLEAGELSEEEAARQLQSRLGMEKNDAYWQVKDWTNGDESLYADYWQAVETGENLLSVTREYLDNGKTNSTLSSQITKYFKPLYIELAGTDPVAAANMKARILTAYEALGYDREKKNKDIDKWLQ